MSANNIVAIIVGLLMGIPALAIFSVVGYRQLLPALASARWPVVHGVVHHASTASSEVLDHNSVTGRFETKTHRRAVIRFTYTVDGGEYTGDQVWFGMKIAGEDAYDVDRMMQRYKDGDTVPVFYDPRRPARSVLEPGPTRFHFYMMITAGVLLFFASLMVAPAVPRPFGPLLGIVLSAILLYGGYMIGYSYAWAEQRGAAASTAWPIAEGTVTAHRSIPYNAHGTRGAMPVSIRYEYEVDGEQRIGSRRWYGYGDPADTKTDIAQYLGNYHETGIVPVRYNPNSPGESVLVPGSDMVRRLPLWTGIALAAMGLIGALLSASLIGSGAQGAPGVQSRQS